MTEEEFENKENTEQVNFNDETHSFEQNPMAEEVQSEPLHSLDISPVMTRTERVKAEIGQVIVGQEEMLDLLLVALFGRV